MKHELLLFLALVVPLADCKATAETNSAPSPSVARQSETSGDTGFVVLPGPTNELRFRLYTNASPAAGHLFNTFDLEAYGESWLRSPGGEPMKRLLGQSTTNTWLHNVLVDGEGPILAPTNSMVLLQTASGPQWRFVALDVSAAYRGRLEQYRRGILFIEPDLFVLHDHLVANKPVRYEMALHPPAGVRVDSVWRDLRFAAPKGGLQIHAPGRRREVRSWERIESAADAILKDTVTMRLGPASPQAELDVLVVFALHREGAREDFAFKFLESDTAIGARIHRAGLPTLIAFKTATNAANASLTGFGFIGPVGVDIFKPRQKRSE